MRQIAAHGAHGLQEQLSVAIILLPTPPMILKEAVCAMFPRTITAARQDHRRRLTGGRTGRTDHVELVFQHVVKRPGHRLLEQGKWRSLEW